MTDNKPLVLDVDGTFLNTDMLFENFWAGLGQAPVATLKICAAHFSAPARLKQELAALVTMRTDLLPVNPQIKAVAEETLSSGREVVLASASDKVLVEQLARDHGLSPRSFASDGRTNLKGDAKADALVQAYGEGGFHYAGDNKVDRAIWQHADGVLIVGNHPELASEMAAAGKQVAKYPGGWKSRDLIRALRPHQWVKNILLFLPVLAAHNFTLPVMLMVLLGMVAFSAAASSIYIVNDLLDLEADRLHVKKRHRPFAAGKVPIRIGMITGAGLALLALGIGAYLGWAFLLVVILYMVLSLAYSLRLKRMRWVDIATLASLYTLRVVAGAAASGVVASGFMLVFIFPVFITLGCVKRLTELTLATSDERLPGRGYGRKDREDLLNVGGLGVAGALVIFFLYSFSEQATLLYPTRWLLWVGLLPLAWWLIRMLRLGYLGKQDYDPIVFAMTDKRGIGILMILLSLMFYSAGLWQQWLGF